LIYLFLFNFTIEYFWQSRTADLCARLKMYDDSKYARVPQNGRGDVENWQEPAYRMRRKIADEGTTSRWTVAPDARR
jgi:hypothetical protein